MPLAIRVLVGAVPGCRTGAKGFPIDCGWATDLISLLVTFTFVLGIPIFFVGVPCVLLGGTIWAWAVFSRGRTSKDA
jgi:hypothetical protein